MINLSSRAVLLTAVLAAAAPAFAEGGAWLVQASGRVEVDGPSGAIEAAPPARLPEGSTVKTGGDGAALLMTADGAKIQLQSGTSLTYAGTSTRETTFSLFRGEASCWVRRQGGRRFLLRAPGAAASARGAEFSAASDGATTRFDLFKGELLVADSFGRKMIETSGQRVRLSVEHGLSGTSSLPTNASAPEEPAGELPPGARPAAQPEVAKTAAPAPAPAAEVASETESPAPAPAPGPAPSPEQEATVVPVSPSAP